MQAMVQQFFFLNNARLKITEQDRRSLGGMARSPFDTINFQYPPRPIHMDQNGRTIFTMVLVVDVIFFTRDIARRRVALDHRRSFARIAMQYLAHQVGLFNNNPVSKSIS